VCVAKVGRRVLRCRLACFIQTTKKNKEILFCPVTPVIARATVKLAANLFLCLWFFFDFGMEADVEVASRMWNSVMLINFTGSRSVPDDGPDLFFLTDSDKLSVSPIQGLRLRCASTNNTSLYTEGQIKNLCIFGEIKKDDIKRKHR
jgi:hypothetical protein